MRIRLAAIALGISLSLFANMHKDSILKALTSHDKETAMADQEKIEAMDTRWDLSVLYSGLEDPALDADMEKTEQMAKSFSFAHKGRLATTLGRAITDLGEISMLEDKILVYLFLRSSTDLTNEAVKTKMQSIEERLSLLSGEHLTFFDHELVALTDAEIETLAQEDEVVKHHLPWIRHARVFKKHLLPEAVEAALVKRSPFGAGSWAGFFDEVEGDLRFEFQGDKKTLTEILDILSNDPDGDVRAEALKVINDGLTGPFRKYSAQTLNMIVRSKSLSDAERGYSHPMEARNKGSKIPDDVVDALHIAVEKTAAPLAQRYYRLKARLLGRKTLRWSDRNAPMPFVDDTIIPYPEAIEKVMSAYDSFSPQLAELIREQIGERRIDAPAHEGKQGGAFNYSLMLPGKKPISFTFLNYLGSSRDVMTVAHELGHGVHGLLAGEAQGPHMFRAPMAYAETASVFGEMTTFRALRAEVAESGDKKRLLAMTMDKMDDIINTVVRQIGFSNFERLVHGVPGRLSPDELDDLWMQTTKALYGESGDVFTYDDTEHLWCYVGHFHRPFYVYAYAFGELLTQSLYAQQEALGDRFEPLYLDMLRSGSTKDVVELLEPFGLDPTDPQFWTHGIEVSLGSLIQEAEQLTDELGIEAR